MFNLQEQDPNEVLSASLTREEWLGVLTGLTSAMADCQRVAGTIDPDTFHGAHARQALREAWEAWQGCTVKLARMVIPEFEAKAREQEQAAEQARNELFDLLFRKDKDDA